VGFEYSYFRKEFFEDKQDVQMKKVKRKNRVKRFVTKGCNKDDDRYQLTPLDMANTGVNLTPMGDNVDLLKKHDWNKPRAFTNMDILKNSNDSINSKLLSVMMIEDEFLNDRQNSLSKRKVLEHLDISLQQVDE